MINALIHPVTLTFDLSATKPFFRVFSFSLLCCLMVFFLVFFINLLVRFVQWLLPVSFWLHVKHLHSNSHSHSHISKNLVPITYTKLEPTLWSFVFSYAPGEQTNRRIRTFYPHRPTLLAAWVNTCKTRVSTLTMAVRISLPRAALQPYTPYS